jgi:hypothetical protein
LFCTKKSGGQPIIKIFLKPIAFFSIDLKNPKSYPGSGSTVYDLSDNKNNITLINSPTYNSSGYLDFNGTSQYGQVTTKTSYTPYCIDIWFYNDDTIGTDVMQGNYQAIAGFSTNSWISCGGWTGDATNETIMFWNRTTPYGGTYIRDTISPGLHNIVVNWTGSRYDIWIDGVKKTTYDASPTYTQATLTSCTHVTIGAQVNNSDSYEFDGRIYNVKIYTSQKTDAQVLNNYNRIKARFS